MGFDSFPIVNQGAQCDLTFREDDNASISTSTLESLGRNHFRRSSIRNRNGFSVDAKKDCFEQKPAAKMLPSTRSRNGVKPSVSYTLHSALLTIFAKISNHLALIYCNCNAYPN